MSSSLQRIDELNREHLRFLEALVNAIPNPVFFKDAQGRYRFFNEAFMRLLGVEAEDLAGRKVAELPGAIPGELAELYRLQDEALLASGSTQRYEAPVRCHDGVRDFLFTKAVFRDARKQPVGIIGVMADVSQRKVAERALEMSQKRLEQAMDLAMLANWEYDFERGEFVFDDRFYEQIGVRVEQAGGYRMRAEEYAKRFVHPEDAGIVARELEAAIATTDPDYRRELESRVIRGDGKVMWVHVRFAIIKDAFGRTVRMYGANQDITDKKRADEELRTMRQALEHSPSAVVITDIDGTIKYVNPQFERVTGYGPEEVLGKKPSLWKSGLHDKIFYRRMWKTLFEGKVWRGEICNRGKEGNLFWESAAISPVRNARQEITHFVAMKEDITEQRKAAEQLQRTRQALQESEMRLRTMMSVTPLAFYVVEGQTDRVLYYNRQFVRIWGLQEREGQLRNGGITHAELMPTFVSAAADPDAFARSWTALGDENNRAIVEDEIPLLQNRTLRRYSAQIRDEQDHYLGRVYLFEDVSRRKEADRKLEASVLEKEVLLREVYHRVKNNLQVISSLLNLQSGAITDAGTLRLIRETQERVRSMALVHEKLYRAKDLSRINFAEYIRQLAGMLSRSYRTQARVVEMRFELEEVYLNLDTSVPCGLVLNELVSNALKYAFPVDRVFEESPTITISLQKDAGEGYLLIVADNGVGLPVHVDVGRTQTLGLQVVSMLSEQLGGGLNVERGRGTAFLVRFQEVKEGSGRSAYVGQGRGPAGGGAGI